MEHGLLANSLALASALCGAAISLTVGTSHRGLCALISFAAGTLFATTLFVILPEIMEALSWTPLLISLGTGYLLFYLLSKYVFHVCPACAASHFDEHSHGAFGNFAIVLAIAFGIHSFLDGIALAAAPETHHHAEHSLVLTIAIHKLPEGLALCALLLASGFRKITALVMTFLFEMPTVIGWLAGVLLLASNPNTDWIHLALAHVGGGFVFLALHAVLNESKKHSAQYIVAFFLAGIALISLTHLVL